MWPFLVESTHVHTRNFVLLGGERWIIQDLMRDPSYQSIDEKYRPLFTVLRKLTEKADSICKVDYNACYDAG